MCPNDILHFWFEELTAKQHYAKDPALDATMRERFGATLEAAGFPYSVSPSCNKWATSSWSTAVR